MEKDKTQKVLPSGKVYRQIFDAEVQLVQALENGPKGDASSTNKEGVDHLKPSSCSDVTPKNIPIVGESRGEAGGAGMLTERQRTWTEGFPNESHLENPVVFKYYTEEVREKQKEPRRNVDSREVQALPDVVTPAKPDSGIIERIADSRKQRHESAVEDMHHELGIISAELEPRIQEAGEILLANLDADNQVIDETMTRIEKDEDLARFTEEELGALWEEVAEHSTDRQHWIQELDDTLEELEEERMASVREVFQNYSQLLEKVAHFMRQDLQRMLDKESQMINQTLLSNRRAYADLFSRLMMTDIEREKRLHTQWTVRVEDWKRLHIDQACTDFRALMESSDVVIPPEATRVMEDMRADQEALNNKRLDLITSLRDMRPPSSTKTSIYQWNQQITDVSKQIDSLNQGYFSRLCGVYEKVCQECLASVDALRTDMIERGVCSEHTAQQVVQDRCLPLVGQRQTIFEKSLEEMDRSLETHNTVVLMALKSLFKFCQGAAHVWDVHELGLARQERALQEKLDACRQLHDNGNQDLEANLDIMMDRMRQDATEHTLGNSLRKVLDMMERIKEGYFTFHKGQLEVVGGYPEMVEEELQRYDASVCRYFGVDRTHPEDAARLAAEAQEAEEREEAASPKSKNTAATSRSKSTKKRNKRPGSRASSRASDAAESKPSSPLPMVVSDVLTSAKGTTFYVLTVAGEHGVPPPTPPSQEGGAKEEGEGQEEAPPQGVGDAFMTEVQGKEGEAAEEEKEKVPYLESVEVPDDLLTQVKKQILMNFLDYLEDWSGQAVHRSQSVVAAKTEELNSELDLRLHLHDPRPRRAELDVHNVRAAELVMHSERVTRHCKGINQALGELKHRFNQMTQEHNRLAERFKQDIEALEVIFINATKSSRLVALSSQLQVEQDKYMDVIRASLRQFRQHLDETLQMLRQSNASFIKSFKVFSDGGNFCPEEIEDYRKKLEKMSQKIDSSEGFIMADLEGMESKRLDQASKISHEFEDRFKHHMIDLLFMEKIARWLTNTQVKIKGEVADSNSQAQRLAQALADLARRTDACERPNLDKEVVSPTQLNESLASMFESFHTRSAYLDCLKEPAAPRPSSGSAMQGPPALGGLGARLGTIVSVASAVHGTRVGFASGTLTPISKPGKQPTEDPSVGVIKNILKTQKNRLRFGADADFDGETAPIQQPVIHHGRPQVSKAPRDSLVPDTADNLEKKSRQSQRSNNTDKSRSSNKSGGNVSTGGGALGDRDAKRAGSGTVVHRHSKGPKIDRKYFVFGENAEDGEEEHFLGKVRRVLRDALDGLLAAGEIYYRQKGNRAVTRPQALQENFDLCAEIVVQKLQSYYTQADEYHNQCLQELRAQLVKMESLVSHVPGCVIRELTAKCIEGAKQERSKLQEEYKQKRTELDMAKEVHQMDLRPGLGHPQLNSELDQLCEKEAMRREDSLAGLEKHSTQQQTVAAEQGQMFIEQLASTAEKLLLQFDNMLIVDDLNKGRVPPVKHATSELLRRKNAGQPLEDDEDKDKLPRGKKTWTGIPKTELVSPSGSSAEPQEKLSRRMSMKVKREKDTGRTASVTTAKTTLGQSSVKEGRDAAYQEYKEHFMKTLASIEEDKMTVMVAEQRWTENWTVDVDKVKELY